MFRNKIFRTLIPALLVGLTSLQADQEAANRVHLKSDRWGTVYAKSIPAEDYGTKGQTKVYLVREGEDELDATYDWYANDFYLSHTQSGYSIVQMGPWSRGHGPSREDLAFAFHLSGKLLKSYSTLDIAGNNPDAASASVSHYTVIKEVKGYRELQENKKAFEVVTEDGRVLSYDPETGLEYAPEELARLSYD